MSGPPLCLVGAADCELCTELHGLLAADPAIAAHGLRWVELSDEPSLVARYQFSIPVVLLGDTLIWQGPAAAQTCAEITRALSSAGCIR